MTAPTNTTFVSGTTITSDWLNGVNNHVNNLETIEHTSDKIEFIPAGVGAVTRNVQDKLRETVSVMGFGAVGDGVADDTAAIQTADTAAAAAGLSLSFHAGEFLTSDALTQTTSWVGVPSGSTYNTENLVKIKKVNGNTASNKVVIAGAANIGTSFISLVVQNPPNYYAAVYPTGAPYDSTNPDYGFYGNGFSSLNYYGCTATGFRIKGFELTSGCVVSTVELCDAKYCGVAGISVTSSDCQVINNTGHHNIGDGILASGPYPRLINNRSEWNAGYGINCPSGEFIIVGNTLDRNAKAGLYLDSGWGGTVTGNYFSRNGAGGDGTFGRWAFSTPAGGAASGYVTLGAGESCHIQVKYQRAVTISGNRYRSGQSDSNDGSDSPAYIYRSNNDSVACTVLANAGEYSNTLSGGGYNASYAGGAGVMYGPDFVNQFESDKSRILSRYGRVDNNGTGGSIVVPISSDDTYGEFLVRWSQYPNDGVTKITYRHSSVFGSYYAKTDLITAGGSTPTSASLTVTVNSSGVTIGGYSYLSVANHNASNI